MFSQCAKSERLLDESLREAIYQIEQGLFDANLGGGLYKKRIARKGQGKRGNYRTLALLLLRNGIEPFLCTDFLKVNEKVLVKKKEIFISD